MKHILASLALLCSIVINAQTPKIVNAKLDKATVYLQGAHLYYTESITLKTGINEFAFENISPYINQASLQATVKTGVVMDMKYELVYEEPPATAPITKKYDREIEQVLDSIEDLNYAERAADNKLKVLATEKNMLLNNRIIKGDPLKDSLPLLQQGMEYLRVKLNEIYAEELKQERTKSNIAKKRSQLNIRYQNLLLLQNGKTANQDAAKPIHRVLVTVYSEAPAATQLSFNYFIQNANWTPAYDLQASSSGKNLRMNYFANVSQNSGIDWKGIPLTLSTSTPNQSNTKPVLSPWYLSYMAQYANPSLSNSSVPLKKETLNFRNEIESADDGIQRLTSYINVTENLLRTEYEIKLSYTINSDNKTHKVLINDREVPMELQFAAVPKLSPDAFLMARITGWEEMNIIPGSARLYFDGSFVGEMYLNPSTTDDTLKVNLGRDKTFATTRKKIKENTKQKFLDNDRIETRTIELVVRNTKNQTIDIEVEDQIPVALGTNEIKVTLKDGDGATLDEPSGSLKWSLKLKAKETKKIRFTYEIRYPKDKVVAGL